MSLVYLGALLVALDRAWWCSTCGSGCSSRSHRCARRSCCVVGRRVLPGLGSRRASALGVFFRGNAGLLTGLQFAPELPLEELFFLALLCYLTMNVYARG